MPVDSIRVNMRNKILLILFVLIISALVAGGVYRNNSKKTDFSDLKRQDFPLSERSSWNISNYHQRSNKYNKNSASDGYDILPFTSLSGGAGQPDGQIKIDKNYNTKFISSKLEINFPFPGVPIDLKIIGDKYHFAFRKIFEGNLFELIYSTDGQLIGIQEIILSGVDFPIFRASSVGADRLYWIVYDNKRRKNQLIDIKHANESNGFRLDLPSFYPPAGDTYEMEAPIFLSGDEDSGFQLIAGSLYAKINGEKIETQKMTSCDNVIEAIFTPSGPAVLCLAKEGMGGSYLLGMLDTMHFSPLDMEKGVPWGIAYNEEGIAYVNQANTKEEIAKVFLRDIRNGQQSGVLEFGINNIEGRIPWSQIYYLNGLLDLLLLVDTHKEADAMFGGVANDVLHRIVIEMQALDDLLDMNNGFHTKGFTHDRSAALFAVQTSRLLLLFDRYTEELPNAPVLRNIEKLRHVVFTLSGHIDQLAYDGESSNWMKKGTAHLRWPKCSAFYFDGMAVPFNHQNEWAYSLFNSARIKSVNADVPWLNDPKDMIKFFLERLSNKNGFPTVGKWDYWYGHAYDGWTEKDNRSCNTPAYVGDHGLAWISFRTIDFMSVMSAIDFIPELNDKKILKSAIDAVKFGDVFPFAARSLLANGEKPQIQLPVLERYYRATSPWEISNSPWALVMGTSALVRSNL